MMLEKVKVIIKKVLPETDVSSITEDTDFSTDLSFDSLNMMMFFVELEEAFGFRFSHPVNFEKVSDVCGYLECRI